MAIKLVVEYVNLQASVTSQDVVLSVQTADESAPKLSTTFADLDLQVSNQVIAPISGVLLDFVNLNTFTTRSLSIDSNTLTDTTRDLNSIVLNRQGPYGWPSWKQIRSSEHAIIRKHRKENILSAVFTGKTPFTSAREGYVFDYQRSRVNNNTFTVPRTTENYKEIMVTSKFKPLVVSVHPVATQAAVELLLEIPFRNTLSDIDVFSQYQMAQQHQTYTSQGQNTKLMSTKIICQ